MTDNTATISATKGAVLILEQALDAGLPLPETVETNRLGMVDLAFTYPEQLAAWAEWLDNITIVVDQGTYVRHSFTATIFDQPVRGVCQFLNRTRVGA